MPQERSTLIKVSPAAARRFLIRRSGLGRQVGARSFWASPHDALDAVRAIEYLQVDPMRVLETNHNLVLAARVDGYRPEVLDQLLYQERTLVEVVARNRYIVPVGDFRLFRLRFAEIEQANRPKLAELEPIMERVLERIGQEGPLSSLDFEEQDTVSGWWDADGARQTRAVRQALEWLWHFGHVAVSHRVAGRRYFDLTGRLLGPAAAEVFHLPAGGIEATPEVARARGGLVRKYFQAMGLADPRDWGFGWTRYRAPEKRVLVDRMVTEGAVLPVQVEGVKTVYYVPAAEAADLESAEDWELEPDFRFLPPLDNLIWLRTRLVDLFGFDYTWEAYTPESKRRYGPYTCPILCGDRLIGRIDARMERVKAAGGVAGAGPDSPRGQGTLVINGLWWEEATPAEAGPAGPDLDSDAFRSALEAWAAFNGAAAIDDPTGVLAGRV